MAVTIGALTSSASPEAFRLGQLLDDFVLPRDFNVAPTMFQPVIRQSRDTEAVTVTTRHSGAARLSAGAALVPADGFYDG